MACFACTGAPPLRKILDPPLSSQKPSRSPAFFEQLPMCREIEKGVYCTVFLVRTCDHVIKRKIEMVLCN